MAKQAENDLGKAEALNDQFSSVFTKTSSDKVPLLQQKFPNMSNINVTEEITTRLKYIKSLWSRRNQPKNPERTIS